MKSKKLLKKKYNRNYKSKKYFLKKKKIKSITLKKKRNKKKRKNKKIKSNKINMSGGGIPIGGSIKELLGITHNLETNRENVLDNLCALNSIKPTQDAHLSGVLNQICNLNFSVKKDKKENSSIVKKALRLIGNIATLPLRTASSVVKNVTGFNPGEVVYNSIKSRDRKSVV